MIFFLLNHWHGIILMITGIKLLLCKRDKTVNGHQEKVEYRTIQILD